MVITIERAGDAPSPQSLDLIGHCREFASNAGLVIYAACVIGDKSDLENWVPVLGGAGCDRIIAVSSDDPEATDGDDLRTIISAIRPLVIVSLASHELWMSKSDLADSQRQVESLDEICNIARPTAERPILWVTEASLRTAAEASEQGLADIEIIFLPGRGRED